MDILFLCGLYPSEYKEEIFKNSKRGYQFAAQNLQEAIVDGFVQNKVNLSIITIPFLSTFPIGYKKPVVRFKSSKFNGEVNIECASFINIPFFREIVNTAKKTVFKWCRTTQGVKHIIVYSLNRNLMKHAIDAKNAFKDVKITVIIPDLPEFMASNYYYNILGLRKRDINFIYDHMHQFDNYVLISEAMVNCLDVEEKKYIVLEGIFNSNKTVTKDFEFEPGTKVILYTGALSRKYGIETLLREFSSINNIDYRLVICGDGDAKDLINFSSNIDNRIKYMGKVSHDLILSLQKSASLLINPRTPQGDYTKFSFPSKTMEYLASGTPVLIYRLPGIPDEYFKYCFTHDSFSDGSLAKRMNQILSMPLYERRKVGIAARRFILEEKNALVQVKKILELIK